MSAPLIIQVSHRYNAPPERVFDAWLTPSMASRFLFATRTGNIMRCQIEPEVGGSFTVTDRRPHSDGDESVFDVEHSGTYIEIDRPRRLVFDFSALPYADQPTRVTIEIAAQGVGACQLTLTHDMGDSRYAHELETLTRNGWIKMLATLDKELFTRRIGVLS
ncbi:MAG: hypothetical protein JWQ13_1651 [Ramlibacter sp.]|jgi:uncharacterized protein YndB with AHSA1/START domain|nr:hypothetical protein [Ramlibacter sp.]